jgi:hypothetical protein
MSHTRRSVLAGIGGSALVLGGTATVAARGHGGRGGDEASLRVAHASPDAPPVDVYVNGAKAISGLAFRSVTDYLEVPAGEYDVTVTAAGDPSVVVFDATLELAAEDYTAVAQGELSEGTFGVSLLEDDNGRVFGDTASVRAVHASPDAPAVDVTVNGGALTLFDGLSFGDASAYREVPAGTYTVEVRGDTPDDDGAVVFDAEVTLDAGSIYTVFAVGYLSPDDEPTDEAFGLVPALDKTAPPRGEGQGNPGGRGRGRGGD